MPGRVINIVSPGFVAPECKGQCDSNPLEARTGNQQAPGKWVEGLY